MIGIGALLRRLKLLEPEGWSALERLTYYVFFPPLLVQALYRADFGQIAVARIGAGMLCGIAVMMGLMLATRIPIQSATGIGPAAYSSLFQATTRWNAFVILAVADRLAGAQGLVVVAIAIGVLIVPINIVNVAVVLACSGNGGGPKARIRSILLNPLILGVLCGGLLKASGIALSAPLATVLELLSQPALTLGIVLVGTGLTTRLPRSALSAIGLATAAKLLAMPFMLAGFAWLFGVRGPELVLVALVGAGPAAMNGYIVARQMGGDAPLFAAMATTQTAACFVSMPFVLLVAGYAAG